MMGKRAVRMRAGASPASVVVWMALFCVHAGNAMGAVLEDPIQIAPGLISGKVLEGGVRAYKGIPFAAPPVGDLRWKPPEPVTPWEGIRECLDYGPACPQIDISALLQRSWPNASEDCLYLNVWTPAKDPDEKLPVMVWYHGGGFMIGSASDDYFDLQDLARKGVVTVTTNYRLGPIGFFAHPLLSKESEHNVSGNYGLLDQIAVLKWVQENIAAFGGDPGRVTIFGESGGGRSVAHLMASPLAKGLFHRAIMQSSSLYRALNHVRKPWYNRPSMESAGEQVSRWLGCDQAEDPLVALRALSAEDIVKGSKAALPGILPAPPQGLPFEPCVDGWVLPDDPSNIFDAGEQHDVPLIIGSNADEGSMFLGAVDLDDFDGVRNMIRGAFPKHGDEVLALFPITTQAEAREAMNRVVGDWLCTFSVRCTIRNMDKVSSKAYRYFFTRVRANPRGERLGAGHGEEQRFAFNSLDRGGQPVDDTDRRLADAMSTYWTRFAATGDPNGPGLPTWPAYNSAEDPYLELGDTIRAGKKLRPAISDLYATIEAERRRANP